MSSYNENLNASVVASLQAQELKLNSTQSQLNSAMFTLYYAEDAKITATEKLDKTEETYKDQEEIKEETVDNNNIAVNLLATANQEKSYTQQSVTNTAVAAANVQVATNAIVNLASDMGSILSILNAADYGSQIYQHAKAVTILMNDTAYNAEVTSQWSMESSSLTAEITANTVADMASTTATSINDLLTVLSSQLDATTALQVSDNTALVAASVDEKKAEGLLEDTKVDYKATLYAYTLSIQELNLNLLVKDTTVKGKDHSFTVQFDAYLNPFHYSSEQSPEMTTYAASPVKNYYIIVVKESEKSLFSLGMAEGLISTKNIALEIDPKGQNNIEKVISMKDRLDSNGEVLALGESYVIFVMAQFELEYKKSLNNFEDYLTAPSAPFSITNQLSSPKKEDIKIKGAEKQVLHFHLEETVSNVVEYRCMFLPNNSQLLKGSFTTQDLAVLEVQEVQETYVNSGLIDQKQQDIDSNKTILHAMTEELEANTKSTPRNPKLDSAKEKLEQKINEVNQTIGALEVELKDIIASNVQTAIVQQDDSVSGKVQPIKTAQPGFFFNLLIAENVPDGNYTLPVGNQIKKEGKRIEVVMPIADNTTDNFGNPLLDGQEYIPVVLSYASEPKSNRIQCSNSISDYENTVAFKYEISNK
jgi:hypothetical protein